MLYQYTEFSERHVPETIPRNTNNPGIRSNGRLFRQTRNYTRGNNRTDKLRGDSRILSLSGRLQSIHGIKPDESLYIPTVSRQRGSHEYHKKIFLDKDKKTFKFIKKFAIRDDKHQSTEATYLSYFGKNHLFHIVERECLSQKMAL